MKYPNDMDAPCIALCDAINAQDGLQTIESCCGHGEHPFRIYMRANEINDLLPLIYHLDRCHSGVEGWSCVAYTDCAGDRVTFRIESTSMGDVAYAEAGKIAKLIAEEG